jgi:membrane fusion protein, copper/silver efflux system
MKWLILVIPIAILLLLGSGCDSSQRARAETEQPSAPVPTLTRQGQGPELMTLGPDGVPGLTWTTVREVEMPGVLETTGQITFDDRRVASIISRVVGRIEQIHVSQWDYVRRGQPIVTLYSPDYMTAEAEYLQAKATFNSMPGGGSEKDFARSMVEGARRKLDLLGLEPDQIANIQSAAPSFTMRAPISGNVVQNQALRGSAVNPGDVLYSVGTLDQVWITGDIYEDDLARVHVGQSLEAVTTAYPDRVFHGTIARISPNVDPNTHTLQIRCAVKNPGAMLKPQMLARVQIVTRPGGALLVPQQAIVFDGGAYYVFVKATPNAVERRMVEIGAWNERGYARILTGIKPGEIIAVKQSLQVNALWHEARGESS